MCDFDWHGNHKDLDEWWIGAWTDCIKQYEVDGFRLDISIARPDVRKKIRENAAALGHDIVMFEEGDFPIAGVSDFPQQTVVPSALVGGGARLHALKFGKAGETACSIQYADGKSDEGRTGGNGTPRVARRPNGRKVGRRNGDCPPTEP